MIRRFTISTFVRVVAFSAAVLLCLSHASAQSPESKPVEQPVATPVSSTQATSATSDTSTARDVAASAKVAASKGRAVALPTEKANPVRIPRFETAPVIDGNLDEEQWKKAATLRDFYQTQPGDNIAPSKPTEVYIGYDAKFLYIAFKAYDEPDKIRATIAKRDGIFEDDNVGFFLDTFNDQRKAYEILLNPHGIQADAIYTEGNEDFSFDLVMESKGVITTEGYSLEVAIPFKSLRYEAGKGKSWGVHFFRRIKRFNNELDSWMPLSRDISGTLIQAGKITGLEGISTERTLEIIPSLTVSQTGRRARSFPPQPFPARVPTAFPERFVNKPLEGEFGITTKFSLTPTVTLDFAYNPDFAQVEADQTVVTANQRFPIFFSEKRPFFLEGREIFETTSNVIHTRAIVDPDYAVKLTGKRGRNTFGVLYASDNAPGNYTEDERGAILSGNDLDARDNFLKRVDKNASIGILRLKRDVGRESSVGLFATSYNFIERSNQLVGFDGRFKLDPKTVVGFELIGTSTGTGQKETAERRNAFAYSYIYDFTGRNWGYVFQGEGRTRDYRADVGFTRRTNTNRSLFAWRYSTNPNPKAVLTSFRLQNFTDSDFDWQARQQSWQNGTNLDFNWTHQTFVRIGLNYSYERLFAEEFGGKFFGADSERSTYNKTIFFVLDTTLSKKYSGSIFMGTRRGAFDFDFGAGPRFPRVSPAYLAFLSDPVSQQQPPAIDPGAANSFDAEATLNYQPTNALRLSLNYTKARLTRQDTGLVAFDDNIYTLRGTYQFTRFVFARARMDYDSLAANMRGQLLFGYTPNPGTAFYAGYNDDLNRNGYNPFNGNLEPGFRRNGRTFFIKMSYLFRRSL